VGCGLKEKEGLWHGGWWGGGVADGGGVTEKGVRGWGWGSVLRQGC